MSEIASAFLFEMDVHVDPPIMVGRTPLGYRLVGNITGGRIDGPRFKGKLMPGGADWVMVRRDGSMHLDVRLIIETHDSVNLYIAYGGRMVIPEDLRAQVYDRAVVESVDPALYYIRTNPLFEAPISSGYNWLNNIVTIAAGRQTSVGVNYKVYEIK